MDQQYNDKEKLRELFDRFNKIRKCSGEQAEREFVGWFENTNRRKDDYFRKARISNTIFYDIDIETNEGRLLKIELKTKKSKRSIQLFGPNYPRDISEQPYQDRIEYAKGYFRECIIDNKFDYLIFLLGNECTEVYDNNYFLDNIDKCVIREKYLISFNIPRSEVGIICRICGECFNTKSSNKDVCMKKSCQNTKRKESQAYNVIRRHAINKGYIICYPGRFEPFCNHHYQVYKKLVKEFGVVNILTTDKVSENSPLNFEQKKEVIASYGIPKSRILNIKNPYSSTELIDLLKPNDHKIVYIVAVGRKDSKRLLREGQTNSGLEYYFSEYDKNEKLLPVNIRGYVYVVDDVVNQEQQICSASKLRKIMSNPKLSKEEKIDSWRKMTSLDESYFEIFSRTMVEVKNGSCCRSY